MCTYDGSLVLLHGSPAGIQRGAKIILGALSAAPIPISRLLPARLQAPGETHFGVCETR